jgi:hypothetical protein
MPLKRALLGPWRQHFDDELRLTPKSLENHRKNQEVGLLCSLFCARVVYTQNEPTLVPTLSPNLGSPPPTVKRLKHADWK